MSTSDVQTALFEAGGRPPALTASFDAAAAGDADIEGFGQKTVDLTDGTGTVADGAHEEPGCTVTASADDFGTLLDNPSQGMMLFTMGKLKVSNIGLALSLQKILS